MSSSYGPSGGFGPPDGPPAGPPSGPPTGPPPPPPGNRGGNTVAFLCGGLVLSLLALFGVGVAAGWFDDGKDNGKIAIDSEPTPESRLRDPGTGGTNGIGGTGKGGGEADDPAGSGGSGGSHSQGGSGYNDPPRPDPSAAAFQRVDAGDCLTVYDTGRGGNSASWSTSVPPAAVDCSSTDALVFVSRVTSDTSSCGVAPDKSWWAHTAADGSRTVLCLTRQYHARYCVLGMQEGSGRSATVRLGHMTAVDCKAKRVPKPYNQVMHITGVYKATPGSNANNCVRGQGDQTLYWSWKVNDGKTLLCTMVYQGG